MAAKTSAVTRAVREERIRAQEIDDRRQTQIANQIETIDRLMERLADAEAEISRLRAEQSEA